MKFSHSRTNFILFPAIAMMLGWGLRGSIGGGPFGAMIPGALVALALSMLLKLPLKTAPLFAVFGVVAVGLGGEMTYGQTLGFLRQPETMWWGTLGTTVKGSVWGLLGGMILALGINYNRVKISTIIIGFLVLMIGMLAGFKLINQPMLVYFSDRSNPRPESWGALLTGAILMLIWLRIRIDHVSFRIVWKFSLLGLIGGALGFGLGGFWLVLGSRLSDTVIFREWWKAMEFSFGFILGGFLGLAGWISRKEITYITGYPDGKPDRFRGNIFLEIVVALVTGVIIFYAFAAWLDPVVEKIPRVPYFTHPGWNDAAIMFSNYAFYGLIIIVTAIMFPWAAWQIAISLTFCHTVIDLSADLFAASPEKLIVPARLILITSSTLIVAILSALFNRRNNIVRNMLILLTFSTVSVALIRFISDNGLAAVRGKGFEEAILGSLFVPLVFVLSSIIVVVTAYAKTDEQKPLA